jgi:hypothetical protein
MVRFGRVLCGMTMFVFSSVSLAEPGVSVRLRVIGEQRLEPQAEFLGTRIGGISGIDYDPVWGYLVAISDDPGVRGPVRAYLGRVEVSADRFVTLDWSYLLRLTWGTGALFDAVGSDMEAVRFIPHNDYFGEPSMLITSEGDAGRGVGPRLYEFCSGATRMDEWPAPGTHEPASRRGIRGNRGFEAAAVVGDRLAVVGTEEPLHQDGGGPTADREGWIRLTSYDLGVPLSPATGEVVYPLGPARGVLPGSVTGLTELLALEGGRLLAIERSASPLGVFDVRLFVVEPAGATDVLGRASLADGAFAAVVKTEIAALHELMPGVGNVEAACFGPTLADGTRTLLLATDSNFASGVPTVFTALAIEDDGGVLRPVVIDFGRDGRPD